MLKGIVKRFLSMMLMLLMVIAMAPASISEFTAYADDSGTAIAGLTDSKIGLSYTGDGTWSASGTTIKGSVTGTASGGCSPSASSKSTTLTITNNKSSSAPLKFSYSVNLNGGSISVTNSSGGTSSWSASGTYEETLDSGKSITISMTSAKDAKTTSLEISGISMLVEANATVTFKAAKNGSYTVDGSSVTGDYKVTRSSLDAVKLAASPAAGYKFFGWYSETEDRNLSTNADDSIHFESDQTVYPVFIPENSAIFDVGGSKFYDLNKADQYASDHGHKIVLDTTGTLASGDYSISEGNTLLIPFDDAATTYEDTPESAGNSWTTPSAYKTLTLSDGASIDVKGKLSVSAKHFAEGGSQSQPGGAPTGKYGHIKMDSGSRITVENGGNLYTWGYITGSGSVTAKSGSNVYENMQIGGFRGGSATLSMNGNDKKVFPFSQYFIQNVEVPLTFESGASEMLYSSLYALSMAKGTSVPFIGSGGMFQMGEGTTLTKTYHPDTDRLSFELNGDASINSLKVSVSGASIDSGSYVLPIMNNWDFEQHSGTLTLNQDLAFLPGLSASIDKGATMDIASGNNLYVYDSGSWGNYVLQNSKYLTIAYSPSAHKTRKEADLTDATVDVNGTLQADGYIYTTGDGADIKSSKGTGQVQLVKGAGTATETYQATQSGSSIDYASIPVTSAKLHNGAAYVGKDDEYTATDKAAAGTAYTYHKSEDKWTTGKADPKSVTVKFDSNGGSGTMQDQTVEYGKESELTGSTFTKEGYTFDGWNTKADGNGTSYSDKAKVTLKEDMTLYAQWKVREYTVTWNNADGKTIATDKVAYGETPKYTGETPTRDSDAQYNYTFKGWSPEITKVTGDQTYTAVYDSEVRSYKVTWKNDDGTVLGEDTIAYGTVPSYSGDTPAKAGDAEHSYAFKGWSPSVSEVTSDATYTAEYTESTNKYTVTWNNADGTTIKTDTVAYGETPKYTGDTPKKDSDEQYSYEFKGWTPEIEKVTGNQTYTAVFEPSVRSYTVTWQDYDGTELKTDKVKYGETPVYDGETPKRESTDEYTYTFTGWDPEITAVTGDVTYKAQYKAEKKKYTITWKNEDGSVISTSEAAYGEKPEFTGDQPTKAADKEYEYTFTGWDPEIKEVTGDQTYTAQFSKEARKYTITWKNSDGKTLKTDQVAYGKTPSYDGTPSIDADAHYTATFKGWTPEVKAVSEDATYTAVYEMTGEKHTVTFDSNGGTGSMGSQVFEYGKDTPLNENKFSRDGYLFKGWNTKADGTGTDYADGGSVSTLTDDLTLYAKWVPTGWHTDASGTTWYDNQGRQKYFGTWATIDGKDYYFDVNGYVIKGISDKITGKDGSTEGQYVFDEKTGAFLSDQNGLYNSGEDTYWTKDGMIVEYAGLVKVKKSNGEINYYYFDKDNKAVKNLPESGPDKWITKTNGLLPEWGYHFDEDGVIYHNSDTSLNGFQTVDGKKMYFINGVPAPMGMIKVDGDVYYVTSKGVVITDQSYYCSLIRTDKEKTDFPEITTDYKEGTYKFDKDGKMVQPETKKNGIYKEDGSLYYYEDGKRTYGGVMKIDGAYYYAATSGEIVHAKAGETRNYWISKTNGLLKEKSYKFDENGKMILEDETKNGIYKEDGSLYYYKDGKRAYGGVMKIDGAYYYAATSGEIVHAKAGETRKYWISKTNDLLPERSYTFDENGKIQDAIEKKDTSVNGIVSEDGSLYCYKNGLRYYAGVFEQDGKLYYAATSGEIVHAKAGETRKYWISKTNGLLTEKSYTFDENGVILDGNK